MKKIISALLAAAFTGTLALVLILPNKAKTEAEDVTSKEQKIEGEFLDYISDSDVEIEKYYEEELDVDEILKVTDEAEIYEAGEDAVIPYAEIQQYEKFFELNKAQHPGELAVKEAEERHALYVAAIENGFAVSEKEITDYLTDLKKNLSEALSEKELQNLYSQYESEEAYWAYEHEVYTVNLPIQKYVSSLEDAFITDNQNIMDAEEIQEAWTAEFERIKAKLVEKQKYAELGE